ncbi:MAG: TolC family protein [Candidatus Omnitrophota bacterium]|nr:TolC family protein [Candidatus Omnitrophota bacterium]
MNKMLNRFIIILLVLILATPVSFAKDVPIVLNSIETDKEAKEITINPSMPLSLADCYQLALKQSEVIAISADAIKVAEARFLQALSIMMPYISFQSTDLQEATPNNTGSTLSTLKPAKFSERQFQITQTLFSGFKALAAMSGSGLEKKQRTSEKIRAQQLLLVDVSNSFYLYVEKRKDLEATLRVKKALIDRIKELKLREGLGRSRQSEVVNAKAQLYTVEADLKVVKSQETVARQLLEFLVGIPIDKVSDSYEIPTFLMQEDYYVSKFINRPDIKAADYAWQFAEKELDVVNSDFLPTVSWQGNFYTQRTAFDKGTDWDIMLKIDVPIFEGTEILGKSKEYKLRAHQRELEYMRLKRYAPYDIKDSYVKLNTALAVHENLKKAFHTAKVNYYLQRKDYQRSLVSNLDVLAAIQTLQGAQRNYIHAIYEAKRLYWQLRVSMGEDIVEALNDTI